MNDKTYQTLTSPHFSYLRSNGSKGQIAPVKVYINFITVYLYAYSHDQKSNHLKMVDKRKIMNTQRHKCKNNIFLRYCHLQPSLKENGERKHAAWKKILKKCFPTNLFSFFIMDQFNQNLSLRHPDPCIIQVLEKKCVFMHL